MTSYRQYAENEIAKLESDIQRYNHQLAEGSSEALSQIQELEDRIAMMRRIMEA